jgi:predicted ATPase
MRLISFSVSNFRSITGRHRIAVGNSTVFIGKNNEGKSNLLRALSIAMKALKAHARDPIRFESRDAQGYSWRRDFPISMQEQKGRNESIFRLEFSLDGVEVMEFREEIKSALNGTLPIEIKYGRSDTVAIHVPKRGPGGPALSAKSIKIAKYIADRIDFNYIPAIRTEDEALAVVQDMLSTELAELESNKEYLEALQKISDLQQPILDRVATSIKDSLVAFLPSINNVSVQIPPSARRVALRNQCRVEINDGSPTLLQYKGDGVKSLAALGLLKGKRKLDGASIIAIEEPESHLHPGEMHSLREVIEKLTEDNQVVITTHCPLFVDRSSIASNILIDSNSAKSAKDISSIRKLLGIRASDNLVNASHVLVVEGSADVVALGPLLSHLSPTINKALKQHSLVIEPLGGASHLSYKLTQLSNALCVTHVLLDNDEAGKKAYSKAEEEKILNLADVTFVNCIGMAASELEDCFERSTYEADVLSEFGVDLSHNSFRGKSKWSDRARICFEQQGKPWNPKMESQLKATVAIAIANNPDRALSMHKRSVIDALVAVLESKLRTGESSDG